ncbi:hypothetical protein B0H14DRAFT_2928349 [Mycena olivaceomarginata]|nr:hypothetical protein B0H14DRAFT_2928349 [Mycena olivaceomarginata]
MDRREVGLLMGGGDGEGGVFTWREKNGRKVIRGHGYSHSCDWWSLGSPVSHDGVNVMQQLLCEPEDRLGSQASVSVSRPKSMVMQARRSGFMAPSGTVDGANFIKVHPFFRGIDRLNIHDYPAPSHPELCAPEDARHFDPDILAEPLTPVNGAPVDATRDPLLHHKIHGAEIMDVRRALAFVGFMHKSPRVIRYVRADKAFDSQPDSYGRSLPEPSYGQETSLTQLYLCTIRTKESLEVGVRVVSVTEPIYR